MTSAHRGLARLSPAVAGLALLAACGGGSNGSSGGGSSPNAHNFSGGGSNVVTMAVGNGPAAQNTFNIPYTSVTVCVPGGACATIDHVLVDTGSSGLRLIKSKLATLACSGGGGLCPISDPNPANPGNTIGECLPFADGYAWGSVTLAGVRIGGESATAVPIQIVDDSASPSPAVPANCGVGETDLNSVEDFDANGVLGIGVFAQDCGSGCASDMNNGVYYSCSSAGQCDPATLPLADQVSNPVASFATDHNGVILQLPTISATGAVSASGYLVFGIGTQSNNALQGATVFTVNAGDGNFTTTFSTDNALSGFLDSGSNALFFPDSSLALCPDSSSFYCPSSMVSLSAENEGEDGSTSSASFDVANLDTISSDNYAIADAAGPASSVGGVGGNYFDWGLPFFYGRTVFVAIEGQTAGSAMGPYFAY